MAKYKIRYLNSEEEDPRDKRLRQLQDYLRLAGPRNSPEGQIFRGDWALQHISDSPTLTVTDPEGTTYSAGGRRGNFPNATGYRGRPTADFGTPLGLGQGTPEQQQSMELAQARRTLSPEQFQSTFPNAIPQGGRKTSGYSTVQSPQGGTMDVPTGSLQRYLGKGYTISAPPQPPNLAQEYQYGYGAPNPPAAQVVSGAGGNYLSKGGVMNPIENVPSNSPYSTFGGNLQKTGVGRLLYGLGTGIGSAASGIGTFAANLFNQGRNQGASYMPNYNTTGFMPPPSQAVQNYQQTGSFGGYANRGPNRYFDY